MIINPLGSEAVTAEEVIASIMDSQLPQGLPMEGAQMHLNKLVEFAKSEQIGLLKPDQLEMLKTWMEFIQQMLQQQQQLTQAAGQGEAGLTPGQEGGQQAPNALEAPLA